MHEEIKVRQIKQRKIVQSKIFQIINPKKMKVQHIQEFPIEKPSIKI